MANAPSGQPTKPARLLKVKDAFRLTPNMIRVTFAGPELEGFPVGREGGNCKILIPEQSQTYEEFGAQLLEGPRPITRTYTVRHFRPETLELDVDFVAHGDDGPASAWAGRARPGSFCGFRGPSTAKISAFVADWYLIAADMSALPVAAATMEAMPRDAVGTAIFEVTSEADKQDINAPEGIEIHWLVHDDPHRPSTAQIDFLKAMAWTNGRVQTCIAGESSVIRAFRHFLHNEKALPKVDTYISGYWKIGLVEDEHQTIKRLEAA